MRWFKGGLPLEEASRASLRIVFSTGSVVAQNFVCLVDTTENIPRSWVFVLVWMILQSHLICVEV